MIEHDEGMRWTDPRDGRRYEVGLTGVNASKDPRRRYESAKIHFPGLSLHPYPHRRPLTELDDEELACLLDECRGG